MENVGCSKEEIMRRSLEEITKHIINWHYVVMVYDPALWNFGDAAIDEPNVVQMAHKFIRRWIKKKAGK